jgi:hypothetical protein
MCVGIVGWLLLGSSRASAQTVVINPTTVLFIASADHNATVTVAGQTVPVLTRYELRIFLEGAAAPVTTVDLGKPTPNAQNEVRMTPGELVGLPLGAYTARVAAIGPAGESVSDPSNPFARVRAPAAPTAVRVSGS